jgi:glycine betaine/proline transport system substrate-binding protein
LALLLGVVGCTAGSSVEQGVESSTTTVVERSVVERPAIGDRDERKPLVRLGVTDWTGARVTVAIAERLIESRLGYPVEPVPVLDNRAMIEDLSTGQLAAVLEIWPETLDPVEQALIDDGTVEALGPLGVVGKVGWYLPRSAVANDPALVDWEYLADPAVAARFATAETGDRGRFLATDPNYDQADEDLIDSLNLPFDVVYSGSDAATFDTVTRSVEAGRPVLLFWWTPTAEVTAYDLVEVALPPRTEACEADIAAGEPQACDYPQQTLLKAGWPGLAAAAPDLHAFLAGFTLTTEDQLALIDEIENQGVSIDAAATGWIESNEDRWLAWLAAS